MQHSRPTRAVPDQRRSQVIEVHQLVALLGFAACLAGLLWSRLGGLSLGFWNDEAYSAVKYIDSGPAAIFHGPYVPNNHVLFSWLAWHATSALGREEWVYRLWSVTPAIIALLILWTFVATRLGATTGLLFTILSTTSPVHLELAPQARGYGLAFLAAALLLVGAVRASERPRAVIGWLLVAIGGWVGLATLPVFLLPFAGQIAILLLGRGRKTAALVATSVLLSAALYYGDLLPQIVAARTQQFGAPVDLVTVLVGPFRHLLVHEHSRAPLMAAASIGGPVLASLGARRLYRTGDHVLLAHLLAPVAATYGGVWILQLFIVPRFVSYLLANVLLLVALGLLDVGERLGRTLGALSVRVLAGALAMVVLVAFVRVSREAHSLPIEAYKDVAAVVRNLGAKRAVTNSPYSAGFDYYMPNFVEYPTAAELPDLVCRSSQAIAFIDYPLYRYPADLRCLRERQRLAIKVPQQSGGIEGSMTVWLVDPPPRATTRGAAADATDTASPLT